MNKITFIFLFCGITTLIDFSAIAQKTHVNGYTRKDGTYVHSYDRNSSGQGTSSSGNSTYNYSAPSAPVYYSPPAAPAQTFYPKQRKFYSYTPIGSTSGNSYSHYTVTSYRGARDSHGKIVRSESAKHEFWKMTGYPHGRPGYVVDHIIALKHGGADDPSNMQWQTIAEGKAKDKWE